MPKPEKTYYQTREEADAAVEKAKQLDGIYTQTKSALVYASEFTRGGEKIQGYCVEISQWKG